MFNKLKLSELLALLTILPALGGVTMASKFVNAQNPENNQKPEVSEPPIAVPSLIPPTSPTEEYVKQPVGVKIAAPDGRAVGQLDNLPANLAQDVAVSLPRGISPATGDEISYQIISTVRYRGNGNTILVTTTRPSPAAARRQTIFGNEEQLDDGSMVEVKTSGPRDNPNQVVVKRGALIITVASNLPVEEVKGLAKRVVIGP